MDSLFDNINNMDKYSKLLEGNQLCADPGNFDSQKGKAAYKFKHEFLLNAVNQRGSSYTGRNFVDSPPELIRKCKPVTLKEWIEYYFQNAKEQKKNGDKITIEKFKVLGQKLKLRLEDNFARMELDAPEIDDKICFAYIYNLALLRTWDGYFGEECVQNWIEYKFGYKLESSEEMDAEYGVDRYIELNGRRIGFQIKPKEGLAPMQYLVTLAHEKQHEKFMNRYGGKVFWIYYDEQGILINNEMTNQITNEIDRIVKL